MKEVYGSPLYGIKTGRNEAFVIDRATRNRLVAEDPKSADILKPWLEGKDLKRWRAESRDLFLILFPKGWTKQTFIDLSEEDAWQKLQASYPALSRHLAQFETVCKKRTDKGDYWWELRACDYYKEFEKPKINYPDMSNNPKFTFDTDSCYFGNTGYFIPNSEYYLSALLNSRSIWCYLQGISDFIRGGYYRMFSQNIEKLPIPEASEDDKAYLADLAQQCQAKAQERYKRQQAITRRIPDLCPPERDAKLSNKLKAWWDFADFQAFRKEIKAKFKQDIPLSDRTDWEDWIGQEKQGIHRLTAEITRLEAQINTKVYELFHLTDQEITLLESSLTKG